MRLLSRSVDGDSWSLGQAPVVLAAGLCFAIAMLVWLGYVSTREWQRETNVLLEQREAEALALASTAIGRDMKGMWTTVVAPLNVFEFEEEAPYDLMRITARAFARFPYPESFLLWNKGTARTLVFNRTERVPPWFDGEYDGEPFPVSLVRNPPQLEHAIALVRDIKPNSRFVWMNVDLGGVPYQIIAHRMFSAEPPHDLRAIVAFTVNLNWVSRESTSVPCSARSRKSAATRMRSRYRSPTAGGRWLRRAVRRRRSVSIFSGRSRCCSSTARSRRSCRIATRRSNSGCST